MQFSLKTLITVVACIAALIAWFDRGRNSVVQYNSFISNDASFWPAMERIRSEAEYQDWNARIPTSQWSWRATKATLPEGVDFNVHDYLVIPLPPSSFTGHGDGYSPAIRFGGKLIIMDHSAVDSGAFAQHIAIPKTAIIFFANRWTALIVDVLLVGVAAMLTILTCVSRRLQPDTRRIRARG